MPSVLFDMHDRACMLAGPGRQSFGTVCIRMWVSTAYCQCSLHDYCLELCGFQFNSQRQPRVPDVGWNAPHGTQWLLGLSSADAPGKSKSLLPLTVDKSDASSSQIGRFDS